MNYSTEKSRKRHAKEPFTISDLDQIAICLKLVLRDYDKVAHPLFKDDTLRVLAKIDYQRGVK